jgi:hypothetical protein
MRSAGPSHLVQILVPKETGKGEPIGKDWFDRFLKELTDEFGGATSFLRAPGKGLWQSSGGTEKDRIAVVEVMTGRLDPSYWQSLRERLKRELSQEEIVIRAQEIRRL